MKQWGKVKLGEVLKHRKGFVIIDDNTEYKLCRVQLHRKGVVLREKLFGHQIQTKKQQVCKAGDFLVAEMDAKVGGYGFVTQELDGAIVSSHYFLFEIDVKKIRPQYLEVISQLKVLQEQIKAVGSTNYAAIRPANVLDWDIPLPPIEKQIEIEEIYLRCKNIINKIDKELAFQLTQLENLNQAILQEAVQGKLVPQNPTDEPASQLLNRIKAEKEKSGKKEKPLPPIKPEEIPFEIPESWVWCRLGEISNIVRGGSPRPAGDKTYYDGNIPFLKVGDLTDGNDVYLHKHTFTIKEAGLYKTRFVEANTLMLTNSGATLGYPKICTFPTTFNDGIAAFLELSDDFDKVYIFYFLKSLTRWFLKEASRGQGQPNLNTDIIGFTPFPIPPKEEQTRIVAEIEKQLSKTKQLKEHIIANQQATEQLLKALLHEAFEVSEKTEV